MSNERAGRPRGPMGRGMTGEKAKDFKGTSRKLIAYMGKYRIGIFFVLVFAVGATVFNIIGPKVLGNATTELANGLMAKVQGTGGLDFEKIGSILLFVLALYGVSAIFNFVQGWIMTGITQKVCYRMRREISEKINRMPMRYFESRTVGEVLSRITNDVDTLGQGLNQSITQLITSVSTMLGVLVMMLTISPLMTLITVVILPISLILISLVVKRSQKYFKQQQEYLGNVNGQVEEVYSGHLVVQAFNKQQAAIDKFNQTNQKLYESAWKSQFLSGMMQPIMMFVGNLGYVAVAFSGAILAIQGTITIGDIQAFIQYVRNFTQPIQQIAQVMNMLQSMAAAAERVFEFLDEEEEVMQPEQPLQVEKIEGSVTFEHVAFGYNADKTIIHDFSAVVKPGQKIAIVGPTGAGKTTMVKLLMRFYDVNAGAILVDGHNIQDFNRQELRNAFGMVLQDTWLFKGTIMENIRYGRLDATDEEVIAAAKAAHAHHFIQTLPGGYQMELNEEASNVSQGQKQLITIARAILADNPILILDEATSSVDTRTETRIQKAMNNLMKGRTSFIIAHRLSTIRDADLILVMKDGDIIEQGRHTDLLAKEGFYADLYNSQFEAGKENEPEQEALTAEGIVKYLQPELKQKLQLAVYKSLDSTNNKCKEYAGQGKPEGTVVIAEAQTAGRGRKGKAFYSPADSGIYISFLMRPEFQAQDSLFITTAAAVAAAETIEEVSGNHAEIKWVNDVYCNGRKVCGILTEASTQSETGIPEYVVMGIGFNIREPEGGFPEEIREIAGAVFDRETDVPSSDADIRSRIAAGMINHFWIYYENLMQKTFMTEYKRRSFLLGRQVMTLTEPPIYGKAVDIDAEGHLILECRDGSRRVLSSGEISVRQMQEE